MKAKTFLYLLVILVVLAGPVLAILRSRGKGPASMKMGAYLLEELKVNRVAGISIKSHESSVDLRKGKVGWVVKDRYYYPADFSDIASFLRKLKDMKIGRSFKSSEESLGRLSLKEPDDSGVDEEEKGVRVELKDEEGAPLSVLLLGKPRMTGDKGVMAEGHYITIGEKEDIYLVDKKFAGLEKDPSGWLKKEILKVEKKDIREIICISENGKTTFSLVRSAREDDFKVLKPKTGKALKAQAVDKISTALETLRLEDVIDSSDSGITAAMSKAPIIEYRLFGGLIYRIHTLKETSPGEKFYLTADAICRKKSSKGAGAASGSEAEEEKADEDPCLRAEEINKGLKRWIYEISQWQFDSFITDLKDFLEEEEQEKDKTAS